MTRTRLEHGVSTIFERLIQSQTLLFWTLQVLGWGAYFIVSSLTLTLFYNEPSLPFIAHNLVRAVLGMIFTWPMKWVFAAAWNEPLVRRIIYGVGMALLMSILWTVIIIELFEMMTGQFIMLSDYGGWIYSSVFIFISWAAMYHGVKYYLLLQHERQRVLETEANTQHQLLKRSEAENQARLAKLKFLSYQLNPHFLFNTLNSIYSLIGTGDEDRAKSMVSQLSQFLRASLALGDDILIPLKSEIDTLQRYLEIEKTRFGERLSVEIDCEPESMKILIPIFLLQPLVENSIKHAISKSLNPGKIRVSSRIRDERLFLTVEDSGIDKTNPVKVDVQGVGVGHKNTFERLSVMYKDDFKLDMLDSDLGGTRILVELPSDPKEINT